MRKLSLLIIAVSACSPAVDPHAPGQPCDAGETGTCASSATKVICNEGKWLEYPCDGVFARDGGSQLVGQCIDERTAPYRCVLPVVTVGDFCPRAFEGPIPIDGGTWLGQPGRCIDSAHEAMCRSGKWRACRCRTGCLESEGRQFDVRIFCQADETDPCWGL